MLRASALFFGGSAGAVFYSIRNGVFGTKRVTFTDTKEYTNFVSLKRGLLYDELNASTTNRVVALLHYEAGDDEICAPPSHRMAPIKSFKPIEYDLVRYDKRTELETKMRNHLDLLQRRYQHEPSDVREKIVRQSLNDLVTTFDREYTSPKAP